MKRSYTDRRHLQRCGGNRDTNLDKMWHEGGLEALSLELPVEAEVNNWKREFRPT